MKILSVISQKGGTGKTTIAAGLAVRATMAGRTVAVIDLDPQCNVTKWSDRRNKDDLTVVSCQVGRLAKTLEAAEAGGVDLVIIDTPGNSEAPAIAAAKAADFCLLPFQPHCFDLDTLETVKEILTLGGKPHAAIVFSYCRTSGRRHLDSAEGVAHAGLDICPIVIFNRAGQGDPGNIGLTAVECEPLGTAAREMSRLYVYTDIRLQAH